MRLQNDAGQRFGDMTEDDLALLRERFSVFCRSFYSSNSEDRRNIALKEEHTRNVCVNIREIARQLSFDQEGTLLAETVALFHDVGRFPQYAKYKTFNDKISINHGLLGANTLIDGNMLAPLSGEEKDRVLHAVKFHNAFALPDLRDSETILFLKLVRDADKLDIWRIFVEYYESLPENRASAVSLGFPDVPGYSEAVLAAFREKRPASLAEVRTLNDFKLLGLTWIYDLNFKPSFRMVIDRSCIQRIARKLPHTDEISGFVQILEGFVRSRAEEKWTK